jgi:hypothetical protein
MGGVVSTLLPAAIGILGSVFGGKKGGGGGGGGPHFLPPPDMSAREAQWAREKEELNKKIDQNNARMQQLIDAGQASSAEAARLAKVLAGIEAEKAKKEADVQRRSAEEEARLGRMGLSKNYYNFGVVGTTGENLHQCHWDLQVMT